MLRHASLARYALGLPSVSALIRTLQDNPFVAHACGIDSPDDIPSQPTFSRFFTKLAKRPYANLVRDISREMVRECYRRFPDFGKTVAIDSTDIKAWSAKHQNPPTDPDASWMVKSTSGNLKRFWIGYKAHLAVCADTELPISLTVTTAKVADVNGARPLLRQARYATGAFHPDYVLADAGYSSKALRQHIQRQYRAEPIIKANAAHKKAMKLETAEHRMIFKRRVSVERDYSRLKEHRALNRLTVRRLQKVRLDCFLSVIVLQSAALATHSRVSVRKVA